MGPKYILGSPIFHCIKQNFLWAHIPLRFSIHCLYRQIFKRAPSWSPSPYHLLSLPLSGIHQWHLCSKLCRWLWTPVLPDVSVASGSRPSPPPWNTHIPWLPSSHPPRSCSFLSFTSRLLLLFRASKWWQPSSLHSGPLFPLSSAWPHPFPWVQNHIFTSGSYNFNS